MAFSPKLPVKSATQTTYVVANIRDLTFIPQSSLVCPYFQFVRELIVNNKIVYLDARLRLQNYQ